MPDCFKSLSSSYRGVQGQARKGSLILFPSFQKTQTKRSTRLLLKNTVFTSHTQRSWSAEETAVGWCPRETSSVDVAASDSLTIQLASRGHSRRAKYVREMYSVCPVPCSLYVSRFTSRKGWDQQELCCAGWMHPGSPAPAAESRAHRSLSGFPSGFNLLKLLGSYRLLSPTLCLPARKGLLNSPIRRK